MKEGEEWKTAFRIHYGLYKFLVIPFRLINAQATFLDMINYIFQDTINLGLLEYMNDLLIYPKPRENTTKLSRKYYESAGKLVSHVSRKMHMQATGSGISGIYDRKGRNQNI